MKHWVFFLFGGIVVVILLAMTAVLSMSYLPKEQLTWVAPTERADGTPLSLSDIKYYALYEDGELDYYIGSEYTEIGVYHGHCYKMKTIDTDNRESIFSEDACK